MKISDSYIGERGVKSRIRRGVSALALSGVATLAIGAGASAAFLGSVSPAAASSRTHYCGYVPFGKGWYLTASRNVSCRGAQPVFQGFFRKRACNRWPGSCTVPPFHCHSWFNAPADVGHVLCRASGNRLIRWHSVY
jgi:hypothetical protein